jgi:hypothetical protein
MKTLLITAIILGGCGLAFTQQPIPSPAEPKPQPSVSPLVATPFREPAMPAGDGSRKKFRFPSLDYLPKAPTPASGSVTGSAESDSTGYTVAQEVVVDRRFNWRPALVQSGIFLALQHGFRMTEEKTRRELDGPFFADWKASIRNFRGWDDGGKIFTNYVGHPLQGAVTGRIFINNSGNARRTQIGRDKRYWKSRLKAMAWSAVWSTQFEIGPVSEASLGNVGQKLGSRNRSKMTYSDVVLTPTLGTAWAVGEDAVDKYVLRNWIERKTESRLLVKILRSVLTPTTSVANILRGRAPWRRDFRRN